MSKYSSVHTPHNTFSLAGCISLEAKPSAFGFEWHDSLMPIGANYTALERAIFECACAGCESIWITVDDNWAPLIKKRCGEYIHDPVWYYRKYDVNPSDNQKLIPIFFVPHHPKYRGRRDSLGWGIINSAIYSVRATKSLSSFLTPNKFYAAFPFGIYNPRALIKQRGLISSKKPFYLSHKGKTIKDDRRLGFTFSWDDVKKINVHIHSEGTGVWKTIGEFVKGDQQAWTQRLPAEEQYSARRFTLDKVFEPLNFTGANSLELTWFYNIESWEIYRELMGSEHILKRPAVLTSAPMPPIGVDND